MARLKALGSVLERDQPYIFLLAGEEEIVYLTETYNQNPMVNVFAYSATLPEVGRQ